jgi:thiamine pyrophosphate-dependent acetolactate synthase large subunit-like protein
MSGATEAAESSPFLLLDTLKKAANVLREAGLPFALAGGGAAYARGGARVGPS